MLEEEITEKTQLAENPKADLGVCKAETEKLEAETIELEEQRVELAQQEFGDS